MTTIERITHHHRAARAQRKAAADPTRIHAARVALKATGAIGAPGSDRDVHAGAGPAELEAARAAIAHADRAEHEAAADAHDRAARAAAAGM